MKTFSLWLALPALLFSHLGTASKAIANDDSFTPSDIRSAPARTPRASYVPSPTELFKTLKPAVVKIVLKLHGVPVHIGSGFFISKDGALITNHHVIAQALIDPAFTTEFTLSSGRVIKDFQVADCGDRRQLDICLLKLNTKPQRHFKLAKKSQETFEPDTAVFAIGHPRGLDFSLTRGELKGTRQTKLGVEEIEVTATIAPGNSGGPIFNERGEVIGVATKYTPDVSKVNFGISASEIQQFLIGKNKFYPLATGRQRINSRIRAEAASRLAHELEPALDMAFSGEVPNGAYGMKEYSFELGSETLLLSLPDFFENCRQTRSSSGKTEVVHACFGFGDAAVFTLQRRSAKNGEALLKSNKQRLIDAKPLKLVERLIHDGAWSALESQLSTAHRSGFRSSPVQARCQAQMKNIVPHAAFSAVPTCQFDVVNDTEPGARSFNIWAQKGAHIYSFGIWINDSRLSEYFSKLGSLALYSARTPKPVSAPIPRVIASTLFDRRLYSYEIRFPSTPEFRALSFMGAKIEKDGDHYDLYGTAQPTGEYKDGPLLVITEVDKTVLPPSFDENAKEFALQTTNLLQSQLSEKSLQVEPITVSGRPARIISAFGKDKKGRSVLVLSCTVFGTDSLHVITHSAPSSDFSASYRNFKSLLAGFKRK